MKRSISAFGQILLLTLILLPWQTRALIINAVYDSTVTSQTNAAQIEAAYGVVVQTFENLYTNPITININVFWGNSGFGNSQFNMKGNPSYSQLTNALKSAATTAADTNALASLPPSNPISSVWWIPDAEAKALPSLGLLSANNTNFDGQVFFASNGVSWAFSPTNRAVPGKYDFIAVAEHETSEVMGRCFDLNVNSSPAGYVPYDLFRYTNGVRTLYAFDSGVYFSINKGGTVLKYFNVVTSTPITSDVQDWMPTNTADPYDYELFPNVRAALSCADLTALDILGYNLNFTRPKVATSRVGTGNIQITFTNAPGLEFAVLCSTNQMLPETNWVSLGALTENPIGHYQMTVTNQPSNKARFFRVVLQ